MANLINASDILLSVLFNLLLANITILSCFIFLFLVAFNNFVTSLVQNKNARLILTLVTPIIGPITVAKDAIETPPLVTYKTIKDLSK